MGTGITRILTAVVGIPIIVLFTYLGGVWFWVLVALISILAQLELYELQRKAGWNPLVGIGVLLGLAILLRDFVEWSESAVLILLFVLLISLLRTGPLQKPLHRIAGTLMGVVYPVWLLSFLAVIRSGLEPALSSRDAFATTMTLIVLIWVADTAAYYTGKSMGRHHLAPTISPKKTWEGSIGGVLGAFLAAAAVKLFVLEFLGWLDVGALALIGGAWSQVGDLVESTFKRAAGVKDSASILPGHGGILDRFDSLIVAAPLYYLYLSYVMGLL
ncbi:MAG: phosphatidate cytidylyltransferase [Bacteroidetes bacterium]|nr:phosphatidate cytidylyltransferase [Bacteroidota bacterium]